MLGIDETGDKKKGKTTDDVARQYIGNLGKIDYGIGSVAAKFFFEIFRHGRACCGMPRTWDHLPPGVALEEAIARRFMAGVSHLLFKRALDLPTWGSSPANARLRSKARSCVSSSSVK
jgi:DDE superfamily endonuclease